MNQRAEILLVDDREENLLALEAMLRDEDAVLLKARSGREALELLLDHEVALALLDVQMPEMDGFELAELMRGMARTREIPIVFITAGLHDQARVFRGYESGAVDFLFKPLDGHVLASKVRVFLQLFHQKRQLAERVGELETALGERRQALEALRRSEEHFRAIAESLPQLVFEADAQGRPHYFNRRFEEFLGVRPGSLPALGERVPPDDWLRLEASWRQAVLDSAPLECEHRLRRHDGQYRWFITRAFPVCSAGGRVLRWFGTATDIHELKQTQEALHAADRNKDRFLAMLSHELRNPLAPIKNSLFILGQAAPGSPQGRRAQGVIGRQVDQLVRLVEDLLDVTRITQGKIYIRRERLDLNLLLRHVIEDHRPQIERGEIDLEVRLPAAPAFVDGDGTRLAQVVGNLLQNSIKFTSPGGAIRISAQLDPSRGQAAIRVADNGMGIEPTLLPQLFRPFTQADTSLSRTQGGLGLGLALVKGLVELHGGEVSAHSEGLGRGAEFEVRLPLAEAAAARAPVAAAPVHAVPRRVLIIEDNVDAADSLREVLELGGHQVAVAYDGPEGVARARELRPDVVLCDIGLPGMDGYAVARLLRSDPSLEGVHLVALSGYALPADLERAAAAGFERHVAKPPTPEKLAELLAALPAREWRAEEASPA